MNRRRLIGAAFIAAIALAAYFYLHRWYLHSWETFSTDPVAALAEAEAKMKRILEHSGLNGEVLRGSCTISPRRKQPLVPKNGWHARSAWCRQDSNGFAFAAEIQQVFGWGWEGVYLVARIRPFDEVEYDIEGW